MSKSAVRRLGFAFLIFGFGVLTGSRFVIPTWLTIVYPLLAVIWLLAWDSVTLKYQS